MPYSALNSNYWRLNFEIPSIGSRVMWIQHFDIQTDIQTYIHTDRQTEPDYDIEDMMTYVAINQTLTTRVNSLSLPGLLFFISKRRITQTPISYLLQNNNSKLRPIILFRIKGKKYQHDSPKI